MKNETTKVPWANCATPLGQKFFIEIQVQPPGKKRLRTGPHRTWCTVVLIMTNRKKHTRSSSYSIWRLWKLEEEKKWKARQEPFLRRVRQISHTTTNSSPPPRQGFKAKDSTDVRLQGRSHSVPLLREGQLQKLLSGWRATTSKVMPVVAETAAQYQPSCPRRRVSPHCCVLKHCLPSRPLNLPVPTHKHTCTLRKWYSHLTDRQGCQKWAESLNRCWNWGIRVPESNMLVFFVDRYRQANSLVRKTRARTKAWKHLDKQYGVAQAPACLCRSENRFSSAGRGQRGLQNHLHQARPKKKKKFHMVN